jgi:ligand-binding sensor domain-containing protein/signal transduction histidine kinase
VEDFTAMLAKFVRFRILKTNVREPCLDELEIYAEGDPLRNLALASAGTKVTASGTLQGYEIHQLAWVQDGLYGNTHSWIADSVSNAWVCLQLPSAARINRVVWSRDREGYLIDRLPTEYILDVSTNGQDWTVVTSSDDRKSLPAGEIFGGYGPGFRQALLRFAPISSTLPPAGQESFSEYHLDRWQTEEGLPANEVTALLQAADGYLWVGTSAGLARFDGVRFTRFGEAEGIQTSRILCLFQDRQGTLWVGTDGSGLFYGVGGRFHSLTRRDGLPSDVVMDLKQDAAGRLWIATYAGLCGWQNGCLVDDQSLPPRRNEPFTRLLEDKNGMWVVINGFLHQIKDGQYVRKNPGSEPASEIAVAALRRGPTGRLWFGGISGRLSTSTNGVMTLLPQPANLLSDTILDVCETMSGDLWMGMASSGLRRWRKGEVMTVTTRDGLLDNSIRCLLEDRERNLWVGTSAGGLHRLKPKKLRTFTTADGLTHNVIMSLAEDADGYLWVGSNGGGLSRGTSNSFTPADLSYLLDNESLPSVLAGHHGVLWLGTWNSGLFRKTGAKLEQFNLSRPDNDEPVVALCEDGTGGLWVGTYQSGLKLFRDGKFTPYGTTNGLGESFITTLSRDKQGRLWIGTGGSGLGCLSGGQLKLYTRAEGLAGNFVRTLYIDGSDVLWIGTSEGLTRFKDGQLASFTRKQGLWDDIISQILEDDQGRLWFGSNRGIFRLNKAELNRVAEGDASLLRPVVYGRADGLANLECTGGFCPAGLKTRDGRLWFSTVKGLAVVDPARLPVDSVPPPVLLEEVRVDRKPLTYAGSRESTGNSRPVEIGPGMGRLEFQYTALSFTAPERVMFRHQLVGFDPAWVEAGTRRVAEYSRLPPGHYEFRVVACNEDSVWNETGATFSLTCLPAFWQTLWFRLLVGATLLGGAGWIAKSWAGRRLQRRLVLVQQQHELEKERTRIARDIHDELGAMLTEISLLSAIGQKHGGEPEAMEANLNRISESAREAVQTVDGIVWAVNPRNDSLDHFANYLVHFAEDLFRLTPTRCRLDVPSFVPHQPIGAQQRHHFLLAIKEACNNVARHSQATEVWVRMTTADQEVSVTVEDNGVGFDPQAVPADHDGLLNMRQRMADLGGELKLTSEPGRGTQVRFTVPMNHL